MKKSYSKLNNKAAELKPIEAINEENKSIIDVYFNNGFNGTKAIKQFRPHITDATARSLFSALLSNDKIKEYISYKNQEVRASLNIQSHNVLNELISWLQADATDYIGVTVEQLKTLPDSVKKCIQSIKHRKKQFTDGRGNLITEEVIDVKIIDKVKALEMINKHIDFYNADNTSKRQTIDISKASPEQRRTLLALMLQQTNQPKTYNDFTPVNTEEE